MTHVPPAPSQRATIDQISTDQLDVSTEAAASRARTCRWCSSNSYRLPTWLTAVVDSRHADRWLRGRTIRNWMESRKTASGGIISPYAATEKRQVRRLVVVLARLLPFVPRRHLGVPIISLLRVAGRTSWLFPLSLGNWRARHNTIRARQSLNISQLPNYNKFCNAVDEDL